MKWFKCAYRLEHICGPVSCRCGATSDRNVFTLTEVEGGNRKVRRRTILEMQIPVGQFFYAVYPAVH